MTSAMPYVYIDDLALIFNYKNKETAYKAVQAGVFPVATYRLAGQIVADREVIREFFRLRREEGFHLLRTCPHCGESLRKRL